MIGIKLKALRKSRKETQTEIANIIGIEKATYSAYERGRVNIPSERLKILADHFNVSTSYLLDEEDKNNTEIINELNVIIYEMKENKLFYNQKPLNEKQKWILEETFLTLKNSIKILEEDK